MTAFYFLRRYCKNFSLFGHRFFFMLDIYFEMVDFNVSLIFTEMPSCNGVNKSWGQADSSWLNERYWQRYPEQRAEMLRGLQIVKDDVARKMGA